MDKSNTAAISHVAGDTLRMVFSYSQPNMLGRFAAVSRFGAVAVQDDELWSHWSTALGVDGGRPAIRAIVEGRGCWRSVPTSSDTTTMCPSARDLCAAATLDDGSVILQGGRKGNRMFSDTWKLKITKSPSGNAAQWHDLPGMTLDVGPGARVHQDVCILGNQFFVVHGGLRPEGYRDNDTFVLDIAAEPPSWTEVTRGVVHDRRRPTARFHHTFTTIGHGKSTLIIGGHDRTIATIDDAAILEIPEPDKSWAWRLAPSLRQRPNPASRPINSTLACQPRAFHAAAAVGTHHVAVFGGVDDDGDPLDDLWIVDTLFEQARELQPPGSPPPARSRHGAVVSGTVLAIFGGSPGSAQFQQNAVDLWTVDLADALEGRHATASWNRLAFIAYHTQGFCWPRHWLWPWMYSHGGYLVAFGGFRSTSGFDRFGDPVRAESGEAAGDASGALLALPWHDLLDSRKWRVLSTKKSESWHALPVAIVARRGHPPLLIGTRESNGVPCLSVHEMLLAGQLPVEGTKRGGDTQAVDSRNLDGPSVSKTSSAAEVLMSPSSSRQGELCRLSWWQRLHKALKPANCSFGGCPKRLGLPQSFMRRLRP